MIKKTLKYIIPIKLHTRLKSISRKILLLSFYWSDIKHLIYKNKTLKDESKFFDTKAKVIKYYHRLEKSLSTPNFTKGRGARAAYDLINALSVSHSTHFDLDDIQIKVARNVLNQFIEKQDDEDVIKLKDLTSKLDIEIDFSISGGSLTLENDYFLKHINGNFRDLSSHRHSVRDYEKQEVDISLIYEAINIAQKTPSVCNRQGWHVILITNSDVIKLFREIHNGFARPDQYLSSLIVVCFSKSSFDYPLERNQGYTDGGLFSMSIMYALTHLGLASCPLNANISKDAEKKLRNAINLSNEFGLVMFIAVGHYKDKTIVPVSQRDPHNKKIHHIK